MADTTGTREFGMSWDGYLQVDAFELDAQKKLVFDEYDWTVNSRSSILTVLDDCSVKAMTDVEVTQARAIRKTTTDESLWLFVTLGAAPFGAASTHHAYQPLFNYYIVGRHKTKTTIARSIELLITTRAKRNA